MGRAQAGLEDAPARLRRMAGSITTSGRFCGCWAEKKIKMCFQDRGVSSANQEHFPGGAQRSTLL